MVYDRLLPGLTCRDLPPMEVGQSGGVFVHQPVSSSGVRCLSLLLDPLGKWYYLPFIAMPAVPVWPSL